MGIILNIKGFKNIVKKEWSINRMIFEAIKLNYKINFDSQEIVNNKTGEILKPFKNNQGYLHVTLRISGFYSRIAVHRIMYIAKNGWKYKSTKEIAHLDHNKLNNHPSNLKAMNPIAHLKYDGGINRLKKYAFSRKSFWEPCAMCSSPEGAIYGHDKTPTRKSGAIFGLPGKFCHSCYGKKYREFKKKVKVA